MADQLINPFQDVQDNPITTAETYGQPQLDNLFSLQIGAGNVAFKADSSGIWLGADRFADAPFSVDMNGNIIAQSLGLGNYVTKTDTGQNLTGSVNLGTSSVILDGVNKRIIINDGSNDRILIGYQSGGF